MHKLPNKLRFSGKPEWVSKISDLRERLKLNQSEFARRLQTSPMAVSRWERGIQEPLSHSYIAIGNLAGDTQCWYFWQRAGLHREDLIRVIPNLRQSLQQERMAGVEIVTAGSGAKKLDQKMQLVAIPLLKAVAASPGEKGDELLALHDAPADSMIAAPKDWCPNPSSTSCLRVRGHSMEPTMCDGDIIAVDSSQTDISKLNGKIVIAWNRDKGLTVSRLKSYDHTDVLQPENPAYESITLAKRDKKWKLVAKALWWTRKAS
jgi:SOS-response transcriptional repressor LexA